ncbi:MAG: fructose bisphosphate aldolase [Planctomycetota bacterium]
MSFEQQLLKVREQQGFIAALDQSGGSTPKALKLYGVSESEYSGDEEMYTRVHEMRTRIITDPAFNGDRILGAILFENTMDRAIRGLGSAEFLWNEKRVVPFLKVDKGLADAADGVQVMKPMPGLDALLARAKKVGVFGTKMRSVIKDANAAGVKAVVDQQFEVGKQILAAGLIPIIEPEVDIHSGDKSGCERLLQDALLAQLDALPAGQEVMLKLTLPEQDDFYKPCIAHRAVLRVVALSGGYSREESNARLARNHGMIASFSRALSEGLSAQQSAAEFHALLNASIQSIFEASRT